MKTISTLALLLFCLIWGENPPIHDAESPQQNVLFIAMDDLRIQLGCYGQSFMKTPNIDRLAAEGIAFRHAYCNQAICMASRASIMSGIRPEHRQIYDCRALEALAPEIVTLNEHFEANGYLTTAIGKVYHHDQDHLAQFGENWHDPTDQWEGRGYISDEAISEMVSNGRFDEKKREKGPAYEMADVPDNHYLDGANAEYAIDQLKTLEQQDQPFFMALGFHKPHLPWCAPKQYWDMYPVDEIALSPAPDYPSNLTPFSLTNWGELRGYFGIPQGTDEISDELAIQLRRAYYASVSYADAQLGKVLDALDELGLRENTIVVLWGDHGWKLGDHHAWSKHTNFEIDVQVPLIISAPDLDQAGLQTESFAELVDLYPTLCDLAGIETPDHLEGISLVPVLKDPGTNSRKEAFSIFPRDRTDETKTVTGFCIGTEDFRYVEWIHLMSGEVKARELYDHRNDAWENHNVADDPSYADIRSSLAQRLRQKFDTAMTWQDTGPKSWLYDLNRLEAARQQYDRQEEPVFSLVQDLVNEANALLEIAPYSVLQKKHIPPSGNMNDYYSIGVYWWPNPETADGLPYIRKDGKRNPEYDQYDGPSLTKMSNAVFTLALAYQYTRNEAYSSKASELIRTWFLDSATAVTPHLEYGQAIPGITEGRGIGIIETGKLVKVVSAAGLLRGSDEFQDSTYPGLQTWINKYLHWMVTSEKGWDERRWHNNHGSSYDSQVAIFGLFTGEDSIAQLILDSVIIKRINRQIEPDGSQPWELERTKSMSYSLKNLDHLIENAILAEYYGSDLWEYESEDGRSIRQAIRFLIPFMLGEKEWTYQQYGGIDSKREHFREIIWISHQYLEDPLIDKAFQIVCSEEEAPLSIMLRYPLIE